jgi:hypothetical protein
VFLKFYFNIISLAFLNTLSLSQVITLCIIFFLLKHQDGKKNDREIDNSDDAALANQKRMNADPLEVMLMNMGYRLSSVDDSDGDSDRRGSEAQVTCPTS